GGVLGKKLRAVFADTKSDRAEGAKAGQEVVSQGADLVVGTCDYDFGAPALLQAQKAGKISVFLCAEDAKAGVAGVGPYFIYGRGRSATRRSLTRRMGIRQAGLPRRLRPSRRQRRI